MLLFTVRGIVVPLSSCLRQSDHSSVSGNVDTDPNYVVGSTTGIRNCFVNSCQPSTKRNQILTTLGLNSVRKLLTLNACLVPSTSSVLCYPVNNSIVSKRVMQQQVQKTAPIYITLTPNPPVDIIKYGCQT
ncbi:uncharacterized protein [Magallana gigas]|uniref:uncharacterized protein n=1 Tax=Magallana gigas TaxID=29159 RepID=UPI003340CE32